MIKLNIFVTISGKNEFSEKFTFKNARKMFNYFRFLRNLFHNCFNNQSHPTAGLTTLSSSRQRSYDTNSVLPVTPLDNSLDYYIIDDYEHKYEPLNVRYSDLKTLDIIPTSTDVLTGDWILRYSDSDSNIYPWKGEKSRSFELVPWRKTNKHRDVWNVQEPAKKWDDSHERKIRDKLKKIETKRVKKLTKTKHAKRAVKKIKIMLSIEMKARNFDILAPKFKTRVFETKTKSDKIEKTVINNKQMESKHWGYFSNRTNQAFREHFKSATLPRRGEDNTFFCKNMNAIKTLNKYKTMTKKKITDENESETTKVQIICRKCANRYKFIP